MSYVWRCLRVTVLKKSWMQHCKQYHLLSKTLLLQQWTARHGLKVAVDFDQFKQQCANSANCNNEKDYATWINHEYKVGDYIVMIKTIGQCSCCKHASPMEDIRTFQPIISSIKLNTLKIQQYSPVGTCSVKLSATSLRSGLSGMSLNFVSHNTFFLIEWFKVMPL